MVSQKVMKLIQASKILQPQNKDAYDYICEMSGRDKLNWDISILLMNSEETSSCT